MSLKNYEASQVSLLERDAGPCCLSLHNVNGCARPDPTVDQIVLDRTEWGGYAKVLLLKFLVLVFEIVPSAAVMAMIVSPK
jgi:hypothetical protein